MPVKTLADDAAALKNGVSGSALQLLNETACDFRVSGKDHGQAVGPTCRVGRETYPCCAAEAKPSHHQWQIPETSDDFVLEGADVQEGAQT